MAAFCGGGLILGPITVASQRSGMPSQEVAYLYTTTDYRQAIYGTYGSIQTGHLSLYKNAWDQAKTTVHVTLYSLGKSSNRLMNNGKRVYYEILRNVSGWQHQIQSTYPMMDIAAANVLMNQFIDFLNYHFY
jgi:hypothetical protein